MDTILYYLINGVSIVIVTTLFEYAKAFTSTVQGDNVPKNTGRFTLNPAKHFEPIGFLLFLFTGYGWANPVETSGRNYKERKTGTLITYLTPIVAAVILAIVLSIAVGMLPGINNLTKYIRLFAALTSKNFAAIAVFNLIPVYPMNGSWIIRCILTPNQAIKYGQYEKPLQILIIFMLLLGWLTPVLDAVVNTII